MGIKYCLGSRQYRQSGLSSGRVTATSRAKEPPCRSYSPGRLFGGFSVLAFAGVSLFGLGAEEGEEDDVADGFGVGEEHGEAVDADAFASGGGEAVAEGSEGGLDR